MAMNTTTALFANPTPITGSEGCQCLDVSDILASLTERSCQTTLGGQTGVLLTAEGPCVPHSYGSDTCQRHDLGPEQSKSEIWTKCQELTPATAEEQDDTDYCSIPWCYVNPKSCMLSSERMHRSMYFPHDEGVDLFYSYTTCDPSIDGWSSIPPKNTLGGITITATCPTAYFPPYNYKRSPAGDILAVAGEGHYDNSVPFEGVLINYLKSLEDISDGDFSVSFTHGSKASNLVHPTSAYTAAIQDVEDGLVDMVVAASWVTGQRLQMAAFTVPLYYSRTVLVIPEPRTFDALSAQMAKVTEPFTWESWLMIIATIIFAAILSVWFSDRATVAKKRFNSQRMRDSTGQEEKSRSKSVYARLVLDAIIQNGIFFCSAGVNQEEGDNLPHKMLMLGFGGFILIVVSAYVANLAASGMGDYIGTLDEVKEKEKKVCALPALKTELEMSHPTANFVFSQSGKSYYGLIDDYDAKRCDFIAVGKEDAKSNIELMNMFCERNLVFTESLIIENQVSFPIRPDLAAGLSYWIYQGAKYHDISVDTSQKEYDLLYKRQATCRDFEFNEQESEADDYKQIKPENLFSPIIFFLLFAVIATMLKLYLRRELKQGSSAPLAGRTQSLRRFSPQPKSRPDLSRDPRCTDLYCDDEKSDIEAQDTTNAPRKRAIPFAGGDTAKAKRRDSTGSDTILRDEFSDNPSSTVVHRSLMAGSAPVDQLEYDDTTKPPRKNSIPFATDADEEDNTTNGILRYDDTTKAKRRGSTDSNTGLLDEFYYNPSENEEDNTGNGTSRLERLVETGAFDEILACVQEIKRQKEN